MSEQPLARSEVELSLDFDDLDQELQRDLARRVKRAAATAEKELNRIPRASRKAGQQLAGDLGDGAAAAARQVRRAARQVEADLAAAADAGGELGDNVDASAGRATAALGRVERAARNVQQSLFDIGDDGGFVEIERAVENVQQALFDLDNVEISTEGIRRSAADTAASLDEAADSARRLGAEADRAGRQGGEGLDDLGQKIKGVGREADRGRLSLNRYTTRLALMASAIALAAAAAPVLVAGAAGLGAALALSVPSIAAVIQGTADMADRWDGLTGSQRVAVAQTQQLIATYKRLAAAVEPDSLRLYNAALGETIRLLPRLRPLAEDALQALTGSVQTLGQGFDSPRAREFFEFLQANARPAIEAVTGLLMDFGAAAVSTVQALAPLGGGVLALATGMLRLLTLLNDVAPALAQLAVTAIALRTPLAAAGGLFQGGAKRAATFATSTGKAATAARLLNAVASAGPNIYVAAGVALAFFAVRALTAKSAIDSTINSINGLNRAFGNNIEGYRAANKQLQSQLIPTQNRLAEATRAVGREASATNVQLAQGALAADSFVRVPVEAAMKANEAAIKRVNTAAQQLVNAGFAPSIESATRLATAAGVDLSKALDENGTLSASAAAKIATYSTSVSLAGQTTAVLADAWRRAKDEALGLTAQTQALQEVMDRFLNPSLAMLDATNRLREVQGQVNKAFREGNVTSLQRQQFLSAEVAALRDKLIAEQRATGSTAKTTAETLKLLPALSRLAGNSKVGQAAIIALARSLDGAREDAAGAIEVVDRFGNRVRVLPDGKVIKIRAEANTAPAEAAVQRLVRDSSGRVIDVFVRVNGGPTAQAGATGGLVKPGFFQRYARGGPVSGQLKGPGTGTSDSILARLSNGEFVVNARSTRKYLRLLHLINTNRFASGGLVGALPRYANGGSVRARQSRLSIALDLNLSAAAEKTLQRQVKAIGDKLGKDLTRSLLGTPAEINRALTSIEKQIVKAFRGIRTRADDLLIDRLERLNTRLQGLASQRDKIVKAIEDAQQLAESTTAEARQFAGLAGFGDAERADAAAIEATLRDRLARIRAFQRDVEALAARGLDRSLLRQIVEGGPDEGAALARTLRAASRTELARINAVQRQITDTTKDLGRESADLLFDAGAAAGRGFLTGLQAQRKQIVKLMTEIAESVSLTVRRTLKIKSPSRVLDDDAQDTLLGYIKGLQRLRSRVQAELARTVAPGREVERARTLAPPAPRELARTAAPDRAAERNVTVQQTNHIHNVLDPNAVVDIIEGRLVAALR
ncbi:hypothetical protein [Nonomuraea rubra]|uniref:hypothetical protein n=1 Tax=Nonomuraea rubra TaxID=46180 RepID=UPI0033CA2DB9